MPCTSTPIVLSRMFSVCAAKASTAPISNPHQGFPPPKIMLLKAFATAKPAVPTA